VGGADWERTRIYQNPGAEDLGGGSIPYPSNTAAAAPGNLSANVSGSDITFTWTAANDAETPAGGLTYNLRVGSTPGDDNVFAGMANLTTGYRLLPASGNAQKRLSWTLHGVVRPVYWSVQAIDGAFAGGAWAPEAVVP
jgi:hypothetical protein